MSAPDAKKRKKGSEGPPKSIDSIGSIALITNNISGPAMMGLPHLFHAAGIVPTVTCILTVCCCASLCGTFLAESIQSIRGNRNYTKNINFSTAFRVIVGEDWFVLSETLFIMSCMVQACAAIVETAQSLDGFLASFVVGRTWALQILPWPSLVEWSPEDCRPETEFEVESGLEDCTPFHDAGDLVLTLGFVLAALVFYPLGRGNLKETIVIQIVSFATLFVLLTQFYYEFLQRGFAYMASVPWFGSDVSQLAGVVLFNYAFSITVPSWLNEKLPAVNVNQIIWTSTILSSIIYISFGSLAAFSFEHAGSNLLILLSSSKVHMMTRICAAVFGTSIIGSGVPVFCVIIKNALHSGGVCNEQWSLFFGSTLPYLISWMLYQGSLLMTVLNWTGLLVNGMVAFILPLVLALYAFRRSKAGYGPVSVRAVRPEGPAKGKEDTIMAESPPSATGEEDKIRAESPPKATQAPATAAEEEEAEEEEGHEDEDSENEHETQLVQPLWSCLEPLRRFVLLGIIMAFAVTIVVTVVVDALNDEPTDRRRRR